MTQERAPQIDPVRAYLDDINMIPLLSREDEIRLGKLVAAGRAAATELVDSPPATTAKRRRLERAVDAGELAVQQFTEANLRLVVAVAKRYQRSSVPFLDLIQEGNIGLVHAARRFDYERGFRFSTAAIGWIGQAITRAIATKGRAIRLPVAVDRNVALLRPALVSGSADETRFERMARITVETGLTPAQVNEAEKYMANMASLSEAVAGDENLTYGDVVADAGAGLGFREVDRGLLAVSVRDLLLHLADRDREVILLRFGIGCRRHTLEEVGRRFALSRERVRQIEDGALLRLRRPAIRRGMGPEVLAD